MLEVFKIGVEIAAHNNVSSVLGIISRDVMGLHGKVGETEAAIKRLGLAMASIGGIMGGAAIIGGLVKVAEHGRDLVHQQSLIAQGGRSQAEIARMTAAAWKTTGDVIGTGVVHNLALAADLGNVLGDTTKGIAAMPAMAKVGVVLAGFSEGHKVDEHVERDFARFLELRGSLVNEKTGQIDPARLEQQARMGEAIVAGLRGQVDPQKLLMFQSQGGGAAAALSDTGLINMIPLIQAFGRGDKVGTMLSSFEQQLLGGGRNVTEITAHHFEQLGLLKKGHWKQVKGGGIQMDSDAWVDEKGMLSDTAGWVWNRLMPALVKSGVDVHDPGAVQKAVSDLHLRSTVSRMLVELIRNELPFTKDAARVQQARGTDQYAVAAATDPDLKIRAFTEAWQNLMKALGAPLVTGGTDLLLKLAGAVNRLAQMAAAHPQLVFQLEMLAAGLGALMVLGGAIGIMTLALNPFTRTFSALLRLFVGGEGAMAASNMGALAMGISRLCGTLLRLGGILSGPLAFAMAMSPTTIDPNGTERKSIDAHRAMSAEQQKAALDPTKWHAPAGHETWLDRHSGLKGFLERNGILSDDATGYGGQSRTSFAPPNAAPSSAPLAVHVVGGQVAVSNGRDLTRGVTSMQARAASGPSTGATGFDSRTSPLQPGAGGL